METDKFLNSGLKKGEKLVINKVSRQIERFGAKEWDKIVKRSEQYEWIIIAEN